MAYDVIVAGVGSMGAAACRELAARGVRVLGLEAGRAAQSDGLLRRAHTRHSAFVFRAS